MEEGDFTLASGAKAMHRLLDRGGVPIDAVFAANDQMAAGAYTAIQGRGGLRIPEDIAVVGFDDDSFATSVTPPPSPPCITRLLNSARRWPRPW